MKILKRENLWDIIIDYQEWYGGNETRFHYNLSTGLIIGIYIIKLQNLLTFSIVYYINKILEKIWEEKEINFFI